MEAEEILKLFDSYWFELEIFKSHKIYEEIEKTKSSSQISFSSDSPSPKLRSIPSGKVLKYNSSFEIRGPIIDSSMWKNRSIMRRNSRSCKSLSELEFEELKGFMDLGFVFSEDDKDSELVSVVPGLNRLGKERVEEMKKEDLISRPYLSEAWEVLDRKRVNRKLINWKVQALNDRTNLKDQLKVWAHIVASTVR